MRIFLISTPSTYPSFYIFLCMYVWCLFNLWSFSFAPFFLYLFMYVWCLFNFDPSLLHPSFYIYLCMYDACLIVILLFCFNGKPWRALFWVQALYIVELVTFLLSVLFVQKIKRLEMRGPFGYLLLWFRWMIYLGFHLEMLSESIFPWIMVNFFHIYVWDDETKTFGI